MARRLRILVIALVMGLILAVSTTALAEGRSRAESITAYYRTDLKLIINGKLVSPEVTPFILNPGWLMVPAEFISQELGATMSWDDATSTLTITSKAGTAASTVSAAGGTAASSAPKDIKGVIAMVSSSVVLITTYGSSGQGLSQGSGVVVAKDMIVTNLHVIAGATKVEVTDSAGKVYTSPGIVAVNAASDLAILKCETALTPVRLGDSGKVAVGDQVVAIGNPRGLQGTVSDGIVSGLREFDGRNYIQMTAPISPGSSGGGLFAMDGSLIGITTGLVRDSQNLNLAVPANLVTALVASPGPVSAFPGAPAAPKTAATVTYSFSNGDKYEGQAKDGKPHGVGTYTWADGGKYAGQFVEGKPHGGGTMIWPSGAVYIGDFFQGEIVGYGAFAWPSGSTYAGEVEHAKPNGQGTYIWASGDKYVGGFIDGQKVGIGTYTWPSGTKFVGEYKNDVPNGLGVYQYPDGRIVGGTYVNGTRTSSGTP